MPRQEFVRIAAVPAALCLLLASSQLTAGPIWDEPTPTDAGAFPDDALQPAGTGQLSLIRGQLDGAAAALGNAQLGTPDFQDMFLIRIVKPSSFKASTIAADGGATDFDTQLFLFDADGFGLLANDDGLTGPPGGPSRLVAASNDGSGFSVTECGLYYLAISGYDSDPLTSGALDIFAETARTEVSGPDGPGATVGPVARWDGSGEIGTYEIFLVGVEFPPDPAVFPGDADGDTDVDIDDLNIVLGNFGDTGPPGDLDGDGDVDITDLNLVLGNFGTSCPVIVE